MASVNGTMTIIWTVDIPEEVQRKKNICDDPVKEALLEFIPQSGFVWIWGKNKPPCEVWIEKDEEEITIDEDNRIDP